MFMEVFTMKLACVISAPDVDRGPLALLSGTFEEKLTKARNLGYAGVELMVRNVSELDIDDVRAALERHALEVPQIVTGELFGTDGLALVHPDALVCETAMRRSEEIVQVAGALGRGTIVNVGRLRGRMDWLDIDDRSEARTRFIQAFQALADYAAPYGVRVTLEPCNRYEVDFVRSTREGLEVAAEVDRPNFGLMLDVFHMNIEDPSIEDAFREARAVLWHVHIADSNRLPPGQGHLDFASIVETLREIGYDGYLSAEMRPLPDPDTAARLTAEHMSRFL
jgi:sugar phosphate isomerase/epimerase